MPPLGVILSIISEQDIKFFFQAMGYEYKSQAELNRERKDFREVLLYDRIGNAIEAKS